MAKIAFLSHVDYNLYLFRLPIMLRLKKLGWEVYAVCPKGNISNKFKDFGIEHIEYNVERKSLNPFKEIETIYELYRVLRPLNLDILHTFTYKPNIYGTIAGRLAKIPIIINLVEGLGSLYVEDSLKSRSMRKIIEILSSITFRLSDRCIVINSDDVNYLISKKILPKEKGILIKSVGIDSEEYNPKKIDSQKINQLRRELNLKDDQVVILMLSRLLIHKGVLEYFKSAEILKEKYGDKIEFLIAGNFDPGNFYNISKETLQNYIERKIIKFLGWRNDIKELLAISDIFVLPSYREGIPRTLLEAGSMGKPIITADTIGCKEVVEHGRNGFLVPIKDYISLAKSIEILINNEGMRKAFGEYSREKIIREFDIRNIVEQYLRLYNDLLNEKKYEKPKA
ncbi:MAG: galactosyltransferase [Dictyoglomus sp. NZ13-RE01]|nr:MAG: galactosyltransferase [Dictyoglomus sp. NZ13-RE01]